jgi:hypothetical protein
MIDDTISCATPLHDENEVLEVPQIQSLKTATLPA